MAGTVMKSIGGAHCASIIVLETQEGQKECGTIGDQGHSVDSAGLQDRWWWQGQTEACQGTGTGTRDWTEVAATCQGCI